ncbi:MarR family protein [Pseudobythopirellula maris]|uniref:MarR family protein n=1 Tax=Pseudobythopirellula maris TaxID=2527991 RepID=A0A5C5ZHK0_9BACT|nr:MarR family transcriptional regulator [Pseudobythopirellula maris]TWT86889.1 MarR family protein [Pseudobythopirellula maris]
MSLATTDHDASTDGDRTILDHLRKEGTVSVGQLIELLGVTATAVRQRLTRLMGQGLIERELERGGRGRPSHRYRLTTRGLRETGDNYDDLASALWEEVRSIESPEVRLGLLKRLATKLASRLSDGDNHPEGESLAERMRRLMRLMGEREVPIEVDESGDLPVLTVLACPYPTLAEKDRAVCAMEKVMISEMLGQGVKLTECRLDGGGCCSFQPSSAGANAP